jgi:hypothetical protein
MNKAKYLFFAAAIFFGGNLIVQSTLTAARAESAKHAINTKGTGGNNGKAACDTARKYPNKHPDLMKFCDVAEGKLYQTTTSQGTTCCASCNEINSSGGCGSWSQCVSGATGCDPW